MAHVELRMQPGGEGRLLVDGVDISKAVKADSVVIDTANRPHKVNGQPIGPVEVHITLLAHQLDVDLPDAVVIANEGDQ